MNVAWTIAVAVIIPNVGGIIGAFLTVKNLDTWYETLEFPSYHPPNWIFAPMWTLLYIGMGYASYLVWRDGGGFAGDAQWPLTGYVIQLALNWMWSPIFFALHSITGGLIDMAALLVAATLCGVLFWRVNHVAGYLFIPYILWLSFASLLNYAVFILNS